MIKVCPTDGTLFEGRGTYCSAWCKKAKPCRTCSTLKTGQSPYCPDCRRDRTPSVELTHDPVWRARQASRDERPKRRPTEGPAGLWWCAGCREWLSPREFLVWKDIQAGRTAPAACRACRSARGHATRLRTEFKMSPQEYNELLALQGGACAICGGKPVTERLAVDHSHITGETRGLLCSHCNFELLKAAKHDADLLRRAADYLDHPPALRVGAA